MTTQAAVVKVETLPFRYKSSGRKIQIAAGEFHIRPHAIAPLTEAELRPKSGGRANVERFIESIGQVNFKRAIAVNLDRVPFLQFSKYPRHFAEIANQLADAEQWKGLACSTTPLISGAAGTTACSILGIETETASAPPLESHPPRCHCLPDLRPRRGSQASASRSGARIRRVPWRPNPFLHDASLPLSKCGE